MAKRKFKFDYQITCVSGAVINSKRPVTAEAEDFREALKIAEKKALTAHKKAKPQDHAKAIDFPGLADFVAAEEKALRDKGIAEAAKKLAAAAAEKEAKKPKPTKVVTAK